MLIQIAPTPKNREGPTPLATQAQSIKNSGGYRGVPLKHRLLSSLIPKIQKKTQTPFENDF